MSSGSLLLVFYFKINIVIREHFYVSSGSLLLVFYFKINIVIIFYLKSHHYLLFPVFKR
jgi:hypothetical protein